MKGGTHLGRSQVTPPKNWASRRSAYSFSLHSVLCTPQEFQLWGNTCKRREGEELGGIGGRKIRCLQDNTDERFDQTVSDDD